MGLTRRLRDVTGLDLTAAGVERAVRERMQKTGTVLRMDYDPQPGSAEFEALVADLHRDRPTTLDPYGATNPAEFFAVVTEAFFEQPARLRAAHPALYAQLAAFYQQDPAEW